MNRRNFLAGIIQAGIACSVLPSALNYKRTWVRKPDEYIFVPNPEYIDAPYEISFFFHDKPFTSVTPVIVKRFSEITQEELRKQDNKIEEAYPVRINANGESVQPYMKQKI